MELRFGDVAAKHSTPTNITTSSDETIARAGQMAGMLGRVYSDNERRGSAFDLSHSKENGSRSLKTVAEVPMALL